MLGNRRAMSRATWSSARWVHTQRCSASGTAAQAATAAAKAAARTHPGVSVTRSMPNTTRYPTTTPHAAPATASTSLIRQTRPRNA